MTVISEICRLSDILKFNLRGAICLANRASLYTNYQIPSTEDCSCKIKFLRRHRYVCLLIPLTRADTANIGCRIYQLTSNFGFGPFVLTSSKFITCAVVKFSARKRLSSFVISPLNTFSFFSK